MNLQEIVNAANNFTDENFNATGVVDFVNEAIGVINGEVNSTLPFFEVDSIDENYEGLSDTWVRALLIPYASYGIKQNDGSLSEASTYYNIFLDSLERLQRNIETAIPANYQNDDFGGVYEMDFSKSVNVGWFGNNLLDDGEDF